MAASAAGTRVTAAGPAALVVGPGMLEVRFAGVAGAGREGAFPVADLHQVPQQVTGLVAGCLIPVVAVGDGDGPEADVVVPAAGQGECPGAPSVRGPGLAGAPGEGPRPVAGAGARWRGLAAASPGGSGAAVADGVSLGAGDRHAPGAVRAAGGRAGEVPAQGGVQGAEAVCLAGPVGESEQVGEGDGEVGRGGQRRAGPARPVGLPGGRAAILPGAAGAVIARITISG